MNPDYRHVMLYAKNAYLTSNDIVDDLARIYQHRSNCLSVGLDDIWYNTVEACYMYVPVRVIQREFMRRLFEPMSLNPCEIFFKEKIDISHVLNRLINCMRLVSLNELPCDIDDWSFFGYPDPEVLPINEDGIYKA